MNKSLQKAIKQLGHAIDNLDLVAADHALTGVERNKARSARRLLQQVAMALSSGPAYATEPFAREFDVDTTINGLMKS